MVALNPTWHKLVIGDSKLMREVKDETVHLVVTSPPYWQLKDYGTMNQIGQSNKTYNEYLEMLSDVFNECVRVLTPDGKLCINIMPIFLSGNGSKFKRRVTKIVLTDIDLIMEKTERMYLHSLYIWDKRKVARFSSYGSYPYPPNVFSTFPYEWIMVFAKAGKRPSVSKEIKKLSKIQHEDWENWCVNSLWEMQPASATKEKHPAPFPEELPRRIIKLHSFVGDTVLDPFLGSGTTMKVARDLGRNSIGFEINPEYLSVIKQKVEWGKQTLERASAKVQYELVIRERTQEEMAVCPIDSA